MQAGGRQHTQPFSAGARNPTYPKPCCLHLDVAAGLLLLLLCAGLDPRPHPGFLQETQQADGRGWWSVSKRKCRQLASSLVCEQAGSTAAAAQLHAASLPSGAVLPHQHPCTAQPTHLYCHPSDTCTASLACPPVPPVFSSATRASPTMTAPSGTTLYRPCQCTCTASPVFSSATRACSRAAARSCCTRSNSGASAALKSCKQGSGNVVQKSWMAARGAGSPKLTTSVHSHPRAPDGSARRHTQLIVPLPFALPMAAQGGQGAVAQQPGLALLLLPSPFTNGPPCLLRHRSLPRVWRQVSCQRRNLSGRLRDLHRCSRLLRPPCRSLPRSRLFRCR